MDTTVKLDRIDIRILSELQMNARITNHKLADVVGLSPSPCLQRVRKLERRGLIGPYRADIDLDRICRNVTVIATLTLKTHEHKDFKEFDKIIEKIPDIVECYKVSGAFDYFLRFVCADMASYQDSSEELLKSGPAVSQISSHVVLARGKVFAGYHLEHLL